MIYKLFNDRNGNLRSVIKIDGSDTNVCIPLSPDNTDYQQYLKWVEEGNTPLPADSEPTGENNEGAA